MLLGLHKHNRAHPFLRGARSDVGSRILGTMTMTREVISSDTSTWRTATSMFPESDACSEQTGQSRYPAV